METIKKYYAAIAGLVVGFVGLLLYFLSRKGSEVETLKSKIALAKTEKQVDVIETEIKILKSNKDNLTKQNEALDKSLEVVQNRREEVKEEVKNLKDPKAIADYWENN